MGKYEYQSKTLTMELLASVPNLKLLRWVTMSNKAKY